MEQSLIYIQDNNEIEFYLAPMMNTLNFIPGERYLFLITRFQKEEKLELLLPYSYYVTEKDNIVAATWEEDDASEDYTGYRLKDYKEILADKWEKYRNTYQPENKDTY